MSYCRQLALPQTEPVSLTEAKNFCKVPASVTDDDLLIGGLIQAAREYAEKRTGRAIAQRQFVLVMDSHPYYTDTVQSQLAFPPNYYSLPRYSTTLWNYSQMIKVPKAPLKSVDSMRYIDATGNAVTLHQDVDFVVDRISELGRIFPLPGQFWPADLYVANSVEIIFTAGYDPNPAATADTHTVSATPPNQQPDSVVVLAVPQAIRTAILMLVAHWYANREPATEGQAGSIPNHLDQLLWSYSVIDFAPNKG
jgi:Phage gp6-like head-tail connector protein